MKVVDFGFEPNETLDATERYILSQIARLQEEYQKAAAPYFDQLSRLNSTWPRCYVVIEPRRDL